MRDYSIICVANKNEKNMSQNIEKITLEINGMTCNGCSSHIEKVMNKTNGIINSNVNHETGKGEFTFDTNKMGKEELINAVNSIGNYSVVNGIKKEDSFSSTSDTTISKESNFLTYPVEPCPFHTTK